MHEERPNGFDRLAPYYDFLTRVVYGSAVRNSQTHFFSQISPDSKVLVLGGGTGWILKEILRAQSDCQIWYVDSSREMIDRAKKANPEALQVTYILGTSSDVPHDVFSVIIMPFFVDQFAKDTLREMITALTLSSTPSTIWLISDFVNHGVWWEKLLLSWMYAFFRFTCHIEAQSLPDWPTVLEKLSFMKLQSKSFYGGFIETHYYLWNQSLKSTRFNG